MSVIRFISFAALLASVLGKPIRHPPRQSSNFKNIVFNSGVNSQPDIVGRFQTLQSYGVSSWIGFTLDDPNPPDPILISNQIRMVRTEDQVQDGINLVSSANPPQYLQLLNEPNADFYGQTVLSPQDAANALQPFFNISTSTTYLAPPPAWSATSWVTDFFSACNCESLFPIITAHIYALDPNDAISMMQQFMITFPDKKIWVTELAPASMPDSTCLLDDAGMINWMSTVVNFANQQPQIERIFWNSGESQVIAADGVSCKVGLTEVDGSATSVLQAYSGMA